MGIPLGAYIWQQRRHVVGQLEALEASYEPVRRLISANRALNSKAADLVARESLALQLARRRSVTTLLGIINAAIEETSGAVFIQRMTMTQDASSPGVPGAGRVILNATSTIGYDTGPLIEALNRPPFSSVKVTSSETVADGGLARTNHVIECVF
jgi:hypothetical protein